MLTTIEGIYENGQVILKEIPPKMKRVKVLITFMEEADADIPLKKRPLGTMKGTIKMSEDFNDPLEGLNDYR
jgi:hypothetical protein